MERRRPLRMMLASLGAVLCAVLGGHLGPAVASEELPRGVAVPPPAVARINAYREKSRAALGKLDEMVEKTRQGEEDLGAQWQGFCNNMLRELQALEREKLVPASLGAWFQGEVSAWQNVARIGGAMMDLHYRMASTVEEIEDDVKVSEAFIRAWQDRLKTINDLAGRTKDGVEKINQLGADDFGNLKDPLGKLNELLGKLDEHSRTVSRLLAMTRKVKMDFIKARDLAGPYRDELGKLKSQALDPDQTGVFVEHEKRWEETMFRTLTRYMEAVADWKKANQWLGEGEGRKILKDYAYKLLELGNSSLLGSPLPVLTHDFDERLGDWCLGLRQQIVKIVDAARGKTWAKIEEQILSAEEERRMARVEFEQALKTNEETARAKFGEIETRNEKEIADLEKQIAGLDAAALKGRVSDVVAEERRLREQIAAKRREIEKYRRYYFEEWLGREEDKAYKDLRAKIDALDKRLRDLEREQDEAED